MEKHNLGSDASMATHITNIIDRGFVTRDERDRRLEPTKLGIALIHGFRAIDEDLVSPDLRQNIEMQID